VLAGSSAPSSDECVTRQKSPTAPREELLKVPLGNAENLVKGSLWCEPTHNGFVPMRLPQPAWSPVPNL